VLFLDRFSSAFTLDMAGFGSYTPPTWERQEPDLFPAGIEKGLKRD